MDRDDRSGRAGRAVGLAGRSDLAAGPPANPGSALQTLISRLRAELRRAILDQQIESHPFGHRLGVRPDAVDVLAAETMAVRGRGEADRPDCAAAS